MCRKSADKLHEQQKTRVGPGCEHEILVKPWCAHIAARQPPPTSAAARPVAYIQTRRCLQLTLLSNVTPVKVTLDKRL